jgi:hypothetical protein
LKIASSGGLTANEAAVIIKNEKVSAQLLKQIKNMDEYKIICDTCKKMNWTVKQFSDYCLKYKYPVAIVEMFRNGTEASIYSDQASLFAKTVGGSQSEPFILYPSDWDIGMEEIIGAENIYKILKTSLKNLKEGETDDK